MNEYPQSSGNAEEGAPGGVKQYFVNLCLKLKNVPPDKREIRLNNDTGLLKILACLLMLSDHLGKMVFPHAWKIAVSVNSEWLFPQINIMRGFGRLAMPIFAYCIAVGCARTRNIWKYALRLLLMGIFVHPLYQEAMGHVKVIGGFDWLQNFWRLDLIYKYYYSSNLNIFFTLFLPVMIIALYRCKSYVPMALMCLLTWCICSHLDYGWKGVVLVILFYSLIDHPLASFITVFCFMLWWAMPNFASGKTTASSQLYALFSLQLIYLPLKRRVKLPKWAFYAFYPAHLIAILLVQIL